ncbi:Signal peptidase complex subunit SPC2 [Tolypocladium paradoxum]|uniref:Signal peptidase complex subunit 2 n=1 Tax=Tolypocladium paradoxum TaxID=94208 RepID=A0A2S4KWM5_9HYPO|nr:Signal peptidase complex subunit SPC2 [Tolypocladium paradoxum]
MSSGGAVRTSCLLKTVSGALILPPPLAVGVSTCHHDKATLALQTSAPTYIQVRRTAPGLRTLLPTSQRNRNHGELRKGLPLQPRRHVLPRAHLNPQLKNTSDDAIPNYLNSLKFRQSHFLTDVRLALGYVAFALAAACFLWDYKLGFESTKQYTAVAVGLYTMLNGALTYWLSDVEKGTVYQGAAPSGEKITISSSTKKHDPTYRLSITVEPKGAEPQVVEIAKPFAAFFDQTGRFVAAPFQEALASSVPVIGKADPKRVKLASQTMLDANPELLDALLAANPEGSSTAAEAAEKKGGKRRKA